MSLIGASYFSMDDEEVFPPQVASNSSLTWRGEASSTWSDWTIIISSDDNKDHQQIYHVHRNILAAGLCKCDYFQTLFQTRAAAREQDERTSRITLNQEDAANFELLLDFCYNEHTTNSFPINVDNVVSLRSLARYFQCGELMRHVNEFIQQDLNKQTAVFYLRNAFGRDEKLETAARNLICSNLDGIALHSMDTLPRKLFESIVCNEAIAQDHHVYASRHVKSYLDVNPNVLSPPQLLKLTTHLTEIHKSVAHGFLELLQRLNVSPETKGDFEALDGLAIKCAKALAPEWKDLDAAMYGMGCFSDDSTKSDYHNAARCVVPVLQHSLQQAQVDYQQSKDECAALYRQNQVLKRKVSALMSQVSAVETLRAFSLRVEHNLDSDSSESEESSLSSSSSSAEDDDEEEDATSDDDDSSNASEISDW